MRAVLQATFVALALAACGAPSSQFDPKLPSSSTHSSARDDAGPLPPAPTAPEGSRPDQVGMATWYGSGKRTANGERFDPTQYTAAHRKLPFGTWVEVRRPDTGRAVRVRINDRGPWGHDERIIDLSRRAAEDLGMIRDGVVRIELRIVRGP